MQIPTLHFHDGGWCDALKRSYQPGTYQPKTAEEFRALVPFATVHGEIPAGLLAAETIQQVPAGQEGVPFDPFTCEDRDQVAEWAKARGVQFHHACGLDKIREAIKAAAQQVPAGQEG